MSAITIEPITAGSWKLDPVHSSFGFLVLHNRVCKFRAEFEQIEATLENGVLVGAALVESVRSASRQLKEHLLSADFFNAAEAPSITFRSTGIWAEPGGRVEVNGELTIRGVTNQVTADGNVARAENMAGDEVIGFDLYATIDRRDFGLGWQARLPNGLNTLGWGVALEAHFELARA
jgi:polyisoprenoid-binding protein YceI